jgi:ribonucleoside-diphosphate reductase alpha chain
MKKLPKNAQEIMIKRYALRDEEGKPSETPGEILERVVRVVAEAEDNFTKEGVSARRSESEKRFLELLKDVRFMPNGRTLANAGLNNGQLANCFVLPIDDEMGKTEDGIFSILRKAVLVLQSGGGVGFSFGRIRPKGDKAGKGKATGAVSFLKVFDTAFWVIGQGGGRRSACMAVLPVHHPDIREFVRCKEKEGVIEHFNISVGVTDKFMEAVEKDKPFDLINPRNGEVWETIRARDLFEEIVEFAHHNGEPGVLFLDAANRENPVPNQYELEATNPCGEQFLGPYENCCMASVNLAEHVMKRVGQRAKSKEDLYDSVVDWEKLGETVRWTVRWLDNVVEANAYVGAVPELQEAAHRNRRIGVSIMGMADMMYKMGVRYGSEQAVDLAGQLMEYIRFESMRASVDLARERGAFPGIGGSRYDWSRKQETMSNEQGLFVVPKPIRKYKHEFGRPRLNWKGLEKDLKKFGIRNSCQTTIQPTGAIATISGLEGYGCEPVFALSYIMKTHEGAAEKGRDWDELFYESGLFMEVLEKWNKVAKSKERRAKSLRVDVKGVFEEVRKKGTCQGLEIVPEEIQEVFVVSGDIKVMEHVRMQAALQAFVDNAISKTINFPAGATTKDVWQAYMDGWKLGLKGMTVYVTGSRDVVVLETEETKAKSEERRAKSGKAVENEKFNTKNVSSRDSNLTTHDSSEPFVANGNAVLGKTLKKMRPEELVCNDCGANMVLQEGCATCPACGSSHCKV